MTDEHTPTHEEIYEMAVQDKEDMMEKDASGAPEVVYLCEVSAEAFGLPSDVKDVKDIKYVRADLSQVEAQPTWRGMDSAASEVDALNARVAELEGLCEKWIDLATRHIDEYGMKFDVNRMADFWQGLDETRAALPTPPSEGA